MALALARRRPADQRGVLLRLLLDAVAAALIATVLALPLVGVETAEGGGAGLEIHTRFDWVLLGASAVLSGRLVLRFWQLAPGLPGPLRRQSALIAMLFIPAWWAATHPALPAWWRDIDGALPLPAWAWFAIAADLLIGAWWLGSFGAAGRRILLPVAPRVAATPNRYSFAFGAVGVAVAIAWPFLPFSSRYLTDMATSVLIYVMLGWGLNVVVGLAGLLDLGYVAFYAVGAYSFALFAQWFDLSFWQALPIAGILAASFGVILGFPVLRLRGDYLAIVTLGFGEIIRIILINWYNVTGGPNGINGIPRPTFFGLPLQPRAPEGVVTFHQFFGIAFNPDQRIIFLYYVILALALTTNFFTLRLRKLPIGRAWEALREDEIACRALGINPTNVKLSAFAIGAMLGGFAGAFFATRQGFISPESFTFLESATILAIVVLGGMGSQLGVVLAAIVLVTLPEFGREFAQFRMLVFGAAMVGIMVWRPRGLIASREPSLRLHGRTARAQEGA